MKQEKQTRLTRRIRVADSSGQERTVEEWGDFLRVQYADESWSEWSRSGGRLKMGKEHINETDDDSILEVAMTGEKLTVMTPKE